MVRAGETLDNPVTRDRVTFLKTAGDTRGELLELEIVLGPGGFVAAEHVHPNQEERIEVVSGNPRLRVAGAERSAHPGDVVVIPAGTAHRWWNPGDDDARVRIELRPALQMEALFETLAALAHAGKLDRRGFPNALQGAVLVRDFRNEIAPARDPAMPFSWLPLPVLGALLVLLAPVGRALGYRGRHTA